MALGGRAQARTHIMLEMVPSRLEVMLWSKLAYFIDITIPLRQARGLP